MEIRVFPTGTMVEGFAHSASISDFCFDFVLFGHLVHVNFDFN